MKRRPILKPHHEQDGWVYVRVGRETLDASDQADDRFQTSRNGLLLNSIAMPGPRIRTAYNDDADGARVISSRKTEEAVETWEYLQRCEEEGLRVVRSGGCCLWAVFSEHAEAPKWVGGCPTLREAYWRYKAQA